MHRSPKMRHLKAGYFAIFMVRFDAKVLVTIDVLMCACVPIASPHPHVPTACCCAIGLENRDSEQSAVYTCNCVSHINWRNEYSADGWWIKGGKSYFNKFLEDWNTTCDQTVLRSWIHKNSFSGFCSDCLLCIFYSFSVNLKLLFQVVLNFMWKELIAGVRRRVSCYNWAGLSWRVHSIQAQRQHIRWGTKSRASLSYTGVYIFF